MPKTPEYIWYASYGSNINEERFHCYIQGGQPKGSLRQYDGCRDKTLPIQKENITIHHELYFAKSSSTWSNGGVAFIHPDRNETQRTLGRMYLISKEQFVDVVEQENSQSGEVDLDFNKALEDGNFAFNAQTWYGHLILLGTKDGHPIYTFTNTNFLVDEIETPHHTYLNTIIDGLKKSYNLTVEEINQYFGNKRGINGAQA